MIGIFSRIPISLRAWAISKARADDSIEQGPAMINIGASFV